ncbi:MAG: type II toxin-antitoxin system VapC family toxin [Blastocatellia bacterium]
MKETLVDSSVLIDVLMNDEVWFNWSSLALTQAANESAVVINPIIFAEVSTKFQKIEELDMVLPLELCRRDQLPYKAAFLAARAFVKYRRHGGSRIAPMPDFYIGAHATVSGFRILTRDPRRFRRYFRSIELIAP